MYMSILNFIKKVLINFIAICDLKNIMYFSKLESSPLPLFSVNEVAGRITGHLFPNVETGSELLLTFKGFVSG